MNIHASISRIIKMQATNGCLAHGCFFKKPRGQATNGGCGCPEIVASEILGFIRDNKEEFNNQLDLMILPGNSQPCSKK